MTEQTVNTVFAAYIASDSITLSPVQSVPVGIFASLFSAASDPPTYAELSAIDGGHMGYADFFSQAKADGAIS